VGDTAKGMCFVGPTRPSGPAVDQLTADYIAKYNEEPTASYFLSAYDAAELLFLAIEKAAIRESDGTLHIGRQKIAILFMRQKPLMGLPVLSVAINLVIVPNHPSRFSNLKPDTWSQRSRRKYRFP